MCYYCLGFKQIIIIICSSLLNGFCAQTRFVTLYCSSTVFNKYIYIKNKKKGQRLKVVKKLKLKRFSKVTTSWPVVKNPKFGLEAYNINWVWDLFYFQHSSGLSIIKIIKPNSHGPAFDFKRHEGMEGNKP